MQPFIRTTFNFSLRLLVLAGLLFGLFALNGAPAARAASFTVTNLNDSGPGSLRQAILDANATAGEDTINFSVSGTIVLASTLPGMNDAAGLTIDGTGQSITISGNNAVRVMIVNNPLNLINLTIADGFTTGPGAGILNFVATTITISESSIVNNTAGTEGGGIAFLSAGTLTLVNSTIANNTAGFGGGIGSTFAGNTISLINSLVTGNVSNTDTGGIRFSGTLSLINSTVSNNTAVFGGGGISSFRGNLTLTGSTVSGNSGASQSVNGINIFANSTTIVSNSTIANNVGSGLNNGDGSTLSVSNSTIAGNTYVGIGYGGPSGTGTLNIANSILSGNGIDCYNLGILNSSGVNLIQDGSCSIPGALSGDPMLGPLSDNGGPTETMALLPGSPAIDAGDNTVCAAAPVNNLDQRGVVRPQGAHCDIGAYELDNQPPTANAGGTYTGSEGSAITLSGASASDPDMDMLTYAWSVDSALCSFDDASALNPDLTCSDNGSFTATLEVSDGSETASSEASVTVNNVAPTLGAISVNVALVPVNTPFNASADFTDPGVLDTHTASWDWGDGTSTGSVTPGAGSGSVSDSHSYSVPGVYTVKLTVTDNDLADSNESVYQFVVVYDPNGGFVTGGGWIDSPAGAYVANSDLTGKANFGFVAKYKKGTNVPDGNTQFQFKAGDLNFHSSSYEWLVVAGAKAQFKGVGTINGAGNYGFMLTAIDGQINGGGGADKFRIKIWDMDNGDAPIYDNLVGGGADDADPTTTLGGGSIVIHDK